MAGASRLTPAGGFTLCLRLAAPLHLRGRAARKGGARPHALQRALHGALVHHLHVRLRQRKRKTNRRLIRYAPPPAMLSAFAVAARAWQVLARPGSARRQRPAQPLGAGWLSVLYCPVPSREPAQRSQRDSGGASRRRERACSKRRQSSSVGPVPVQSSSASRALAICTKWGHAVRDQPCGRNSAVCRTSAALAASALTSSARSAGSGKGGAAQKRKGKSGLGFRARWRQTESAERRARKTEAARGTHAPDAAGEALSACGPVAVGWASEATATTAAPTDGCVARSADEASRGPSCRATTCGAGDSRDLRGGAVSARLTARLSWRRARTGQPLAAPAAARPKTAAQQER